MSLFDRFKKNEPQAASPSQPPKADTMCLLLMDRVLENVEPAAEHLRTLFGAKAVTDVDKSHPTVSAFTVTFEGLEFWCSYMPAPVPVEVVDISQIAEYSFLLSPEEKQAFRSNRSFWVLAQKGGGTSLEAKRKICWTFSRLCAALLELDGAVGVNVSNSGLLVSKAHYFQQRELMEGKDWNNADGFFPVPLWLWVYGQVQGERSTIQTGGLKEFGLPELGFLNPKKPVGELLNLLYSMASLQITGKQLYRSGAVVPLDEQVEVTCKQEGDMLLFIGA